ncbi:MAG: hypothetical protein JXR64_03790 [Spirochaetales bacterium]|nr:hypothetical protein [Spirochaetales bacterium]
MSRKDNQGKRIITLFLVIIITFSCKLNLDEKLANSRKKLIISASINNQEDNNRNINNGNEYLLKLSKISKDNNLDILVVLNSKGDEIEFFGDIKGFYQLLEIAIEQEEFLFTTESRGLLPSKKKFHIELSVEIFNENYWEYGNSYSYIENYKEYNSFLSWLKYVRVVTSFNQKYGYAVGNHHNGYHTYSDGWYKYNNFQQPTSVPRKKL